MIRTAGSRVTYGMTAISLQKRAVFSFGICVVLVVCAVLTKICRDPGVCFQSVSLIPLQSRTGQARLKEDGNSSSTMPSSLAVSHPVLTSSASNSKVSLNVSHGYLLVLHAGRGSQQAAGLRSFLPAQCWLGSFGLPMNLVQPFIENSIVHTVPPKHAGALNMSNFFDVDHFNDMSRRHGWAGVSSWQEFVKKAPRDVIYIDTNRNDHCSCLGHEADQEPLQVVWTQSEQRRSKCYRGNRENDALQTLSTEHDFCIVRAIKAHPRPRLCTAQEVHGTIFGSWRPENVTLIVERWCPGMYVPNPALSNPGVCKAACDEIMDLFYPSHQLLSHGESYANMHNVGREQYRTAVMLRSEHILTIARQPEEKIHFLSVCLSRTVEIVHSLHSGLVGEQPFVTVDVGRYGSGQVSWKKTLRQSDSTLLLSMVRDVAMNLLNTSLTFEEWEETFAAIAGTRDRGYIAALQQSIASSAKCLVILGGGNFTRLTLMQYLSKHPDPLTWCIHFVCLNNHLVRAYSHRIRTQSKGNVDTKWVPAADIGLHVGSLIR